MNSIIPLELQRLGPGDIPDDVEHFKRWADSACVEWPIELQVRAFKAYEGLACIRYGLIGVGYENATIEEAERIFKLFVRLYGIWRSKSEIEKDQLSPCKNYETRRMHLGRANHAAHYGY